MATQAQIQALIDEIETGAKYPATKMNPLLSVLLKSSVSFYTGIVDPTVTNDNNSDFRPGSVGLNTATGRVFVCTEATIAAAIWKPVSIDSGFESIVMVDAATTQLAINTAFATFSGSVASHIAKLPASPYTGKVVSLALAGAVSSFSILNSASVSVYGSISFASDVYIKVVCTNGTANTWQVFDLNIF
jgi:hypothetical protein